MLRRIHLSDFKSFKDEEVTLSGLTVLVGANASGKSNLLDAIQFLQGLALDLPIADAIRGRWEGGRKVWPGVRGGIPDITRKGASFFGLATGWNIGGELLDHITLTRAEDHPLLKAEVLTSDRHPPYLIDSHAGALKGRAGPDDGASIRVALKGRGKGNSPTQTLSAARSVLHQISTGARVSSEVSRARDALVDALRAAYFLDITPARMRDYASKQSSVLGLEGENVSALTWELCQTADRKADLVDWLTELCAPELEDLDFAETELGDVMLVMVERGGRRIPARSLSDGTLRFLGELVALRTAPEGALLLMEEIENGLHPTRIHLLVEAMETAVAERGIQIIATTHSPQVLQALSPSALQDAVLVARPPGSEGTKLRRLGELEHFDEIAQRRGVDRLFATGWLERAL